MLHHFDENARDDRKSEENQFEKSNTNSVLMTNVPQFVYIETNGNGLKSLVALSFNICLIGDNPEACTNANAANGKFDSTVTLIEEIAYPTGVREAGASVAAALAANTTCDVLMSLSVLTLCWVDIEQRCVLDRDSFI